MKILAIGSIVKAPTDAERAEIMPKEVPHTLQMYLDGKIDQFWFRQDAPGPVFLFNADSVEAAQALLDDMPIVGAGFAQYQLIPVGPLMPLGLLLKK